MIFTVHITSVTFCAQLSSKLNQTQMSVKKLEAGDVKNKEFESQTIRLSSSNKQLRQEIHRMKHQLEVGNITLKLENNLYVFSLTLLRVVGLGVILCLSSNPLKCTFWFKRFEIDLKVT